MNKCEQPTCNNIILCGPRGVCSAFYATTVSHAKQAVNNPVSHRLYSLD